MTTLAELVEKSNFSSDVSLAVVMLAVVEHSGKRKFGQDYNIILWLQKYFCGKTSTYELPHGKTNNLHMRKQSNREADQRLCFRYSDSTIPPLLNSKISSF